VTAVRWLAGVSTLLYVFSRFIPYTLPVYQGIIDLSWSQALHMAFARHLQFGRDFVFCYGPWGFLGRGYYPATRLVAVIAWAILSLVYWCAGWRVARHLSANLLFSWLWVIGFIGITTVPEEVDIDVRLAGWIVLLLVLHFFVEEGPFTLTQALLVISLGWLSLVKFDGMIETMVVTGVIAADNILRHRRFPWILPLLAVSILCFWIAAWQRLDSLGPYLCHSWQIASGYTEAMMLGNNELPAVGCFLLAAALLCALIGHVAWLRYRFFGLLPLSGLVAILFINFKHGYVRYDGHEITATAGLLLASMTGLAVVWPMKKRHLRLAGFLQLLAISVLASFTFGSWGPRGHLPVQLARTFAIPRLVAPVISLCEPGYSQRAYETTLANVHDRYPVPVLEGGVDLYPNKQIILFAHGLRYQGRPALQSYSAYTSELAELNASYLRSDRAASNILFRVEPTDNRFPSLEDGRSWPELLTRYDVRGTSDAVGSYLLLSRSVAPREYRLTPLQNLPARFGEPVNPPSATNGPVWVEMEIENSMAGSIISALYKPPVLSLTVSLRGGGRHDFRLVPALARSGFLLSPVIEDNMSFASLVSKKGQAWLADREVISMTISACTQSGTTACYRSPMQIRFYRLDYPRQDFDLTHVEAGKRTN